MQNRSDLPVVWEDQYMDFSFPVCVTEYVQDQLGVSYLHYHKCLEIGRCVGGSGVQFIEGEIYTFSAQSVSVIAKNCIHEACIPLKTSSERPSVWQYLFVDLEALGIENGIDRSFLINNKRITHLFDLLYDYCTEDREQGRTQIALLLKVMIRELQRLAPQGNPIRKTQNTDVILGALHRIAAEYTSDLTIAELARSCNMSVSYFRKVFVEEVGTGPQQYIIQVRLSMAEELLRNTDLPIQTISNDVGFRTLSSFNRLFKKKNGCAPRDYR